MEAEAEGGVAVVGAGGDGMSAAGVGGGVSSSFPSIIVSANCFGGPSISVTSSRLSGGEGEGEGGRADVGVLGFAEMMRPGGLMIWSGSRDGGDVIIAVGKGDRDCADKELGDISGGQDRCRDRYA